MILKRKIKKKIFKHLKNPKEDKLSKKQKEEKEQVKNVEKVYYRKQELSCFLLCLIVK